MEVKMKKWGIFLLIFVGVVYLGYYQKNNLFEEKSENYKIDRKQYLSMMLETGEGTGEYKTATMSRWPTDGYKFNTELSRCENGSTLSWDTTKNAVVMNGNVSDKCYVYFDVFVPPTFCTLGQNLNSCIINRINSDENLFYHNSALVNGAEDNSYRYSGSSEDVNNYVCFGSDSDVCPHDNLYRIMGVFGENNHGVNGEQLVKIIKSDYANNGLIGVTGNYNKSSTPDLSVYKGSLSSIDRFTWGIGTTASNTWSTSLLNKTNLNTTFLSKIGSEWSSKIQTVTWKVGGNTDTNLNSVVPKSVYQNEVVNPVTTNTTDNVATFNGKVGLMYISDYMYAASPSAWNKTLKNYKENDDNGVSIPTINWLHMGIYEWTITRMVNYTFYAFFVGSGGFANETYTVGTMYHLNNYWASRPSFYLRSSTTYLSGTGKIDDPIRIS